MRVVPERFLLAGSVSGRLLPRGTETLTGRVHRLSLLPLSAAEVLGGSESGWRGSSIPGEVPTVRTDQRRPEVFDVVVAGGYPGALQRTTLRRRQSWFEATSIGGGS